MKASKAKNKSAAFCCYIGPTILGVIQTGTLYPGDKATVLCRPEVALALEKRPLIAALIVDGGEIHAAKASIKSESGPLYQAYKGLAGK